MFVGIQMLENLTKITFVYTVKALLSVVRSDVRFLEHKCNQKFSHNNTKSILFAYKFHYSSSIYNSFSGFLDSSSTHELNIKISVMIIKL